MTTFGVLGAGAIGKAVAGHAVAAGLPVVLSNSRGPESLAPLVAELGPGATAGTIREAAAADIVLLSVPWPTIGDVLGDLPPWDGRILIDATNQFLPGGGIDDLGDETGSERVASLAPGARVVKAFNTLFARVNAANPRHEAGRQVLFFAGDDEDAKATFSALVDGFGFAPIDVGGLRDGGRLMQIDGGFLSGLDVLKRG